MKEWNPRYVLYANDHNMTPEERLAKDDTEYPGGIMCGYIIWMRTKRAEFYKISAGKFIGPKIYPTYGLIEGRWDYIGADKEKAFNEFLTKGELKTK